MSDLAAVITEAERRGWTYSYEEPPADVAVHRFQRGDERFGFTSTMAMGILSAGLIRAELDRREVTA